MEPRILIVTELGDSHAIVVNDALQKRGVFPILWKTTAFPSLATESVRVGDEPLRASRRQDGVSREMYRADVVWFRRHGFLLDQTATHAADLEFIDEECKQFRQGIWPNVATDAFWVNPPAASHHASAKITQLCAARRNGLRIPETLVSNDPRDVRAFVRSVGGVAAFKPLTSRCVWRGDDGVFATYCSSIEIGDLKDDASIAASPGIYQEKVPKQFEVRATVMGNTILAAKIFSQQTRSGRMDWRSAYEELHMEPWEMPPDVHAACLRTLRTLGLEFGCIDLIVRPDGEPVFLEVNEAGQFLFLEEYTDLPVLDTFCQFLEFGRPGFVATASPRPLRLSDFRHTDEVAIDEMNQIHDHLPLIPSESGTAG